MAKGGEVAERRRDVDVPVAEARRPEILVVAGQLGASCARIMRKRYAPTSSESARC